MTTKEPFCDFCGDVMANGMEETAEMTLEMYKEVTDDQLGVIAHLRRVIADAHFYMSRDGNPFKAFQLLSDEVSKFGDPYSYPQTMIGLTKTEE